MIVSDNLITGNGPGSALKFALTIVENLWDKEKALEVADLLATTYD